MFDQNKNSQNSSLCDESSMPTIFVTGIEFVEDSKQKVAIIRFLDNLNKDKVICSVALTPYIIEKFQENISRFLTSIQNDSWWFEAFEYDRFVSILRLCEII